MFPNAEGYALGSIEGRVAIQCVFSFYISSLSLPCEIHLTPLGAVAYIITLGISMIRTKSKHASTQRPLFSVLTNAVLGKTIPLGVIEKTKRQAGKIRLWCSPSMTSSFIPHTGRLLHAVRCTDRSFWIFGTAPAPPVLSHAAVCDHTETALCTTRLYSYPFFALPSLGCVLWPSPCHQNDVLCLRL